MLAVLLPFCAASQAGRAAESVEFARDIRPLFNKHCTSCHGGLKQRLTTVTKPAKVVKEILA